MSKLVPFGTTLLVRDTCLCLHTQRAVRTLVRRFGDALRPIGADKWAILVVDGAQSARALGFGTGRAMLAIDRTTLTAALKPLERLGLVTIDVDPEDRRSRRLTLTGAGLETRARAVLIWRDIHAEISAVLPDSNALRGALRALA